jgi:hypothetical protein
LLPDCYLRKRFARFFGNNPVIFACNGEGAMSPQFYTRRDVRRLMAALGAFVAVPCALLVFLAWQSLHSLHAAAVAQRREALRRDVRDAGRNLQARLEEELVRAGDPLRGRDPAAATFWSDAWQRTAVLAGLRTVLVLDAAGRPLRPRPEDAGGDDLPRLSALHPAQAALQEARTALWAADDPRRAREFYKAILAEARVPEAVRLSVCAEQAQCEERLGDAVAALASYDRMLAEARELAPSVWALLRAAELAREVGDGEREARWRRALLDICHREGLELDLDALRIAGQRLADAAGNAAPEMAGAIGEIQRLAAARGAAANFVRRRGPGPFPFAVGSGARAFESAASASAAADLLMVDVRAPLADGGWLAFEIDLDAWRAQAAEPWLGELERRWGGQVAWVATPAPAAADANADAALLEPLPAPLNAWALRYREKPISVWAALAGSPTKGRAAILGVAAALALLGLAAPGFYLRRSLRLAGLQADVMDRISHELRTPIASLCVLADALERRADGADPEGDRRLRFLVARRSARFGAAQRPAAGFRAAARGHGGGAARTDAARRTGGRDRGAPAGRDGRGGGTLGLDLGTGIVRRRLRRRRARRNPAQSGGERREVQRRARGRPDRTAPFRERRRAGGERSRPRHGRADPAAPVHAVFPRRRAPGGARAGPGPGLGHRSRAGSRARGNHRGALRAGRGSTFEIHLPLAPAPEGRP